MTLLPGASQPFLYLPPVVQIIEPSEARLSLLPDESVRLKGAASDEALGLASVALATRLVNGTQWTEATLSGKTSKEALVEHLLLLAPLQVKAGDTILMKLVATDLKGQKAEVSAAASSS